RHGVSPHAWPRDTCERGILGTLAVSFRAAGVQVEVPSTCPWHLVNPELLRLPRYEHHRDIVATVRADSLQLGISGDVRRARDHALAGHHGCQGNAAPGDRRVMQLAQRSKGILLSPFAAERSVVLPHPMAPAINTPIP